MATGSASDVDFEKVDFNKLVNLDYYINSGSYGQVYGPFTQSSKTFAFKQILLDQSGDCNFKSKVDAKKSIWTLLKHKHLIEILYVSLNDKVVYIAMEYASGSSLRNLLNELDDRVHRQINVTNWARQIADGMLYLHEKNVVHRDLKSSNIVLMERFESLNAHAEMTLKITDFDEVQKNDATATMSFRGTCSHMAPEVLKNEWFSKASDVWSYGVVVWEMLTRQRPHTGLDSTAMILMAMTDKLKLSIPESTPEGFNSLLRDCWCPETKSRPHFKEVIDQLTCIKSTKENLIYTLDPVLVQTIRLEALKEGKKRIDGLAILNKELFVVIEQSSVVEVYDSMELKFVRQCNLKEYLIWPMDIVSCDRNKCLYFIDYKSQPQSKEILRVDPDGKLLKNWSTGDDCGCLSVTAEFNVILTVFGKNKLIEYSPDGQLIREINLKSDPPGICNPRHAIKLTNGHFVVSHGSTENDLHRVCLVDANGNLLKSFGAKCGSTIEQMNQPFYLAVDWNGFVMVADQDNNRVLLLNSDLKFRREILSKEQTHELEDPGKILLDKSNDRMFVAVNEKNNQRILIFKFNNFVTL